MSDAEIIARIAQAFSSRFLRGFARGKLRSDPVPRASFARLHGSPLLAVGCGFGLHAFYLRKREYAGWIVGLDTDEKKIAAGQAIAARGYAGIELRAGNGAAQREFTGDVALAREHRGGKLCRSVRSWCARGSFVQQRVRSDVRNRFIDDPLLNRHDAPKVAVPEQFAIDRARLEQSGKRATREDGLDEQTAGAELNTLRAEIRDCDGELRRAAILDATLSEHSEEHAVQQPSGEDRGETRVGRERWRAPGAERCAPESGA